MRFTGKKWPRYKEVWESRQAGKTYREVGEEFGFTGHRAREMCLKYERELNRPILWHEDLSPRVSRALIASGYDSREKIAVADKFDLLYGVPNFGMKGLRDVMEWLS